MKPITVDHLKQLFFKKYENSIFLTHPPQVKVILTRKQYKELNSDFMNRVEDSLAFHIDDVHNKDFEPDELLYTKITISGVCEFNVELGDKFLFCLMDEEQEYGEETI